MKKLASLILLITSVVLMHADEVPGTYIRDYSIIPPSPEVSALLEYAAPDVDYCSGQPIITVPIYTVKEGTLSLPISLSYASGGLKLGQEPSTAGAGWSVQASAVVGRTVYGKPDETLEGGVRGLMHMDATNRQLMEFLKGIDPIHDPTDIRYLLDEYSPATEWACDYYDGKVDMANDILQVSGLGLVATFAYDYNEPRPEPVISSRQGISISSPSILNTLEYNISDASGLHYRFGEREFTDFASYTGSPELTQAVDTIKYTSAWHLTEYYNDNGDTIRLSYQERPKRLRNSNSQVSYTVTEKYVDRMPNRVASCGTTTYYPKVLHRIESSAVAVVFEYAKEYNTDVVKAIRIYDRRNETVPLRTIEFRYGRSFKTNVYNSSFGRCFLLEVRDNGHITHRFDYYTNADLGIDVDSDTSSPYFGEVDFGGYYNNATGNGNNRVPSVGYIQGGAADRSVNPNYAVFGSLKSIRYGTGGSTDFEWESHRAGYLNENPLSGSSEDVYYTIQSNDTLCAVLNRKLEIALRVDATDRIRLDLTHYFDMSESNYMVQDYFNEHSASFVPRYPRVAFYDRNSNRLIPELTFYIDNKTIHELHGGEPFYISVPTGDYKVRLEYTTDVAGAESDLEREFGTDASYGGRVYIAKYKSNDSQVSDSDSKLWCGLRIKRMTSNSVDGAIHKDFYYWAPGASSGVVQALPHYDYYWYIGFQAPAMPGILWTDVFSISDEGLTNTPLGRPGIQYSRVTTRLSKEDPNAPDTYLSSIRTRHEYSTSRTKGNADYNKTNYLYYQPTGSRMYTSMSHRRGDLLSEAVTDAGGNIVSETRRTYNILEPENTADLTTDLFVLSDFRTAPASFGRAAKFYGIGRYTIIPYTKTISTEYRTDGHGVSRQWTYEYFYDSYTPNADYALRRSASTSTSSGHTLKTWYTYRRGASYYTPDVEVTLNTRDGRVTGGSRKEYDGNSSRVTRTYTLSRRGQNASALIPPTQATTDELKNLFSEPEYSYRYDEGGRLAEIRLRGTVLASYLWGYGGMYPIAEAKGVDYDTLREAAGTTANEAAYEDARVARLGTKLRSAFPDKEIFTISYHLLFGMATMTDGRGLSHTYEYDNLGRLRSVSDFNNYLIKRYEYSTHLSPAD